MTKVNTDNISVQIENEFNWEKWKKEIKVSVPKKNFDVEQLREKYSDFNAESKDAIQQCNVFAKTKCKTIISGQKVHMLASLPHEKHNDTFNWSRWQQAGVRALTKRTELAKQQILSEIAAIGFLLPKSNQLFFAECMEHFLLNGFKTMCEDFNKDLAYHLSDVKSVSDGASQINHWAVSENDRIIQFFY